MGRLSDLYAERIRARQQQIERNLSDARDLLEKELKEALSTPYPRASRPGEAPRLRSGKLRAGTKVTVRMGRGTGTLQMTNPTPYARYLRPTREWEGKTLDRVRPQLDRLLARGLPFGPAT